MWSGPVAQEATDDPGQLLGDVSWDRLIAAQLGKQPIDTGVVRRADGYAAGGDQSRKTANTVVESAQSAGQGHAFAWFFAACQQQFDAAAD